MIFSAFTSCAAITTINFRKFSLAKTETMCPLAVTPNLLPTA